MIEILTFHSSRSVLFPNLQASFLTSKSSCRENVCSVCFVRVRCPQSASRGLNYTLTRIVHTLKKYLNYRCHDTRCSLAYRPQQHPREAIQATATTDGHYGIGFLALLIVTSNLLETYNVSCGTNAHRCITFLKTVASDSLT